MMKTSTIPASLAVISAFCALSALADVPPPEGYVETCTVARQETATSECLACSAYYGATTRCQTTLEPYCYSKVCKSNGASVWTEVLCRTKSASAPVVPQEITSVLPFATEPMPSVSSPGTCPPKATATGTGTGTGTSTATTKNPEKKDDAGCSLGTGTAIRTLGPWSIALVGLLVGALRRRRR